MDHHAESFCSDLKNETSLRVVLSTVNLSRIKSTLSKRPNGDTGNVRHGVLHHETKDMRIETT